MRVIERMASPTHNFPALKSFRRQLRRRLTPAEARLWYELRGSRLDGRKFRRQHSVGRYILDFYCPSEKLAIELDGSAHDSEGAEVSDATRDAYLQTLGIRVVRYENRFVMSNLEGVLLDIRGRFAKRPPRPCGPPLLSEEGKNPKNPA